MASYGMAGLMFALISIVLIDHLLADIITEIETTSNVLTDSVPEEAEGKDQNHEGPPVLRFCGLACA